MLYSTDYDFDVPQVSLTNPDFNLAFNILSNPSRPDSRLVVTSGGEGNFAMLSLNQHRYMEWAGPTLSDTEARIKALEDFRELLRAHYLAIDNGLLPPSLHVFPQKKPRKRRLWFRKRRRPISGGGERKNDQSDNESKDKEEGEKSQDEKENVVKSVVVDIKHLPEEKA
ncbi:hypothetical protein HK097_010033 [Rhizophlyctis rosea]|uniref:Uncharacterized protein n=1 Tax=Rhizophlyctis rosea TaxID=64517 RepID=A0AAD5SBC9_9FUNG|nr:hypothetical protein HK097_010033 [Rhizophlyctis rosea]